MWILIIFKYVIKNKVLNLYVYVYLCRYIYIYIGKDIYIELYIYYNHRLILAFEIFAKNNCYYYIKV